MRSLLTLAFSLLVSASLIAQSSNFNATKPQGEQQPPTSGAPTYGDSTKLEVISVKKADYPMEAAEKRLQGQVVVKVLITETGDVEGVEVISGDPVLAKAAVAAAKQWKFKPYIKNGRPSKVATRIPFDFAFRENVTDKDPANAAKGAAGANILQVPQKITEGMLIHKVQPVYPESARREQIEGTVILRAVIGKDGRISSLTPISGPKELVPAAIGAVQQWRYKPYLLEGQIVEVQTNITVNYQLRH